MATNYSRTRSNDLPDTLQDYEAIIKDVTPWNGGTFKIGASTEAMTDVVTPGYRILIAQGAIINNPCTYEKHTVTGGGGSVEWQNSGHTYWWTGSGAVSEYYYNADKGQAAMWAGITFGVPTSTATRAKALALSNIDSTPYAFGEDTLEIRETLRFLKSPLSSLANLGKTFKRDVQRRKTKNGRLLKKRARSRWGKDAYGRTYNLRNKPSLELGQSVKEHTKAIADVWLQYQFAASPLVRSLADALDAYVVEAPAVPVRISARGFSKDEVINRDQNRVLSVGTGDTRTYSLSRRVNHDYHASILYEVTNPVHDLNWKLGFRLKDVPTTLWQIVPLSFMVDRVWDVTSFSKGIMNLADPKVKIVSASIRGKFEKEESYQLMSETNDIYSGHSRGGKHVATDFSYVRTPWSPSAIDTVPETSLGTLVDSASKIADLAALVRARFS